MGQLIVSDNGYTAPSRRPQYLREVAAIGFRHGRLIVISFIGIVLGALVVARFQPSRYDAGMKLLVKRDRVDPLVTSDTAASLPQFNSEATEEQINSEVELLKSRDLLEKVVTECGLQHRRSSLWSVTGRVEQDVGIPMAGDELKLARAVQKLQKELRIDVIKKTNLISVRYSSDDPQLAARVLTTLAKLYLDKHVAVHRPPGAVQFFGREVARYRQILADAEERVIQFTRGTAVVSAPLQKEAALHKISEFHSTLRQTQAAISEARLRIKTLKSQADSTPDRMTTQVRSAEDGKLLSDLKANVLALEQKHTELLTKFEPGYRPVQQVEAQIRQTRAAIDLAEKSRLREEITDKNPTFEWIKQELAKAEADLAGLEARAKVTADTVHLYEQDARSLEESELLQADLLRAAKTAEANYLLYLRKEEEGRISEALDRGRILNVAIAEAATVPALPSNQRFQTILFGILLATLVSTGLALGSDYIDVTFRTSSELEAYLEIPVLAAIPTHAKINSAASHQNAL